MTNETSTSTAMLVRQQAWFKPFIEIGDLPRFPRERLDRVNTSLSTGYQLLTILGRGPLTYDLPGTANVWFDHGSKDYPTFQCPSIGPEGAGLKASRRTRTIDIDKDSALFLIELQYLAPIRDEDIPVPMPEGDVPPPMNGAGDPVC